jgi:hypothetical protein
VLARLIESHSVGTASFSGAEMARTPQKMYVAVGTSEGRAEISIQVPDVQDLRKFYGLRG